MIILLPCCSIRYPGFCTTWDALSRSSHRPSVRYIIPTASCCKSSGRRKLRTVISRMTMRQHCHRRLSMPTAKKRRRCISGGCAIRSVGWLSSTRPTGSRPLWRPPHGGRRRGGKLPHYVSAKKKKLCHGMCAYAVARSSMAMGFAAPSARSLRGTSSSINRLSSEDITAV